MQIWLQLAVFPAGAGQRTVSRLQRRGRAEILNGGGAGAIPSAARASGLARGPRDLRFSRYRFLTAGSVLTVPAQSLSAHPGTIHLGSLPPQRFALPTRRQAFRDVQRGAGSPKAVFRPIGDWPMKPLSLTPCRFAVCRRRLAVRRTRERWNSLYWRGSSGYIRTRETVRCNRKIAIPGSSAPWARS